MVEQSYALEHLYEIRFTRRPTSFSKKDWFRIRYSDCYQITTAGFHYQDKN